MPKGKRLTKEIFDSDKNGWFSSEDYDRIIDGTIKKAYYGHSEYNEILFGLHIELDSKCEDSRFYIGNFGDISKLRYKTGVKRLSQLKGKKVNVYRKGFNTSGFNLVNYNHKQLEFNFEEQ